VRVVGGSGLLQQFTSDKRLLRRAISLITPQLSAYSAFDSLTSEERIRQQLMNLSSGYVPDSGRSVASIMAANSNIDGSNEATTRSQSVEANPTC
jgi:hypothetical protein